MSLVPLLVHLAADPDMSKILSAAPEWITHKVDRDSILASVRVDGSIADAVGAYSLHDVCTLSTIDDQIRRDEPQSYK